jgi:hypothetical protein
VPQPREPLFPTNPHFPVNGLLSARIKADGGLVQEDAVGTMTLGKLGATGIVLAAGLFIAASSAHAQTDGSRFLIYGVAGGGAFGDDEGWLGGGAVLGLGGGIRIQERWHVEGVVTTMRHEQRESIVWEGRPISSGGRVLYLFGEPDTRARGFVGGGFGIGVYTGTRTDTTLPPGRPPWEVETTTSRLGLTTEAGGGIEIRAGRHFFVRPEGWLLLMHTEHKAGLSSPFVMPRGTVSVGVIF